MYLVGEPKNPTNSHIYTTSGNQLMKEEKYREAIQCYTKAIQLDSANAVFPCNRFVQ